MKAMIMLVRREFWEHRALWIAPLITAMVLLLGATISPGSGVQVRINAGDVQINDSKVDADSAMQWLSAMTPERQQKITVAVIGGLFVAQLLVMLVLLVFYLADALYGERKDRSILFWRSLPVSDTATVASKLATALIAVPVLVLCYSLLTGAIAVPILEWKFSDTPFEPLLNWQFGLWLKTSALIALDMLVAILWYAPLAAFLLLVSAWAKRNVFVWVFVPVLVLIVAEKWTFDTDHVADFLGHRFTGFLTALGASQKVAVSGGSADKAVGTVIDSMDRFDASGLLGSAELWLGVAIAAALAFLTVRVRRYRDDT
ncbi:MAG: hypothetical protein R3E77_16215 [Steroidobacteraceae bacterium]